MLSSTTDKAKLFAKNFSKNSYLDDSGISLPVFLSRTKLKMHNNSNLKMHNISVTSTMVKKIITNLDSSKASGPDCIPVVVLKNCEPELLYILAEPFKMCLKESCFPDCWKASLVVLVFKNVGEMSTAKNYPVSLLSVVSKVLVKWFVNDLADVICNIAIYADDTTLCSNCDQASDLWQQLELASELESGLRDTVDWGRKWLVDFDSGKTQFEWSNNTGAIELPPRKLEP